MGSVAGDFDFLTSHQVLDLTGRDHFTVVDILEGICVFITTGIAIHAGFATFGSTLLIEHLHQLGGLAVINNVHGWLLCCLLYPYYSKMGILGQPRKIWICNIIVTCCIYATIQDVCFFLEHVHRRVSLANHPVAVFLAYRNLRKYVRPMLLPYGPYH